MGDRADIERVVREAYAARTRNDLEACLAAFAEKPVFRIAGAPASSQVSGMTTGQTELRKTLADLIRAFEWLDHTIASIVVDGAKVAVHGRLKMKFATTGEVVETELADFIEVKDGRIVSFIEFCDTALVARLMATPG
jgi:ketosteroid isomerase-like protein